MGIKPSWDKPSWRVTALALLLLMIALAQCLGSVQVSGAHPWFLLHLPPAVGQDGKVEPGSSPSCIVQVGHEGCAWGRFGNSSSSRC